MRVIAHVAAALFVVAGAVVVIATDQVSSWSWLVFAIVAAVVQALAAFVPDGALRSSSLARAAAVGTLAYAVFWVLVALPGVNSETGFLFALGASAVAVAAWLGWRASRTSA